MKTYSVIVSGYGDGGYFPIGNVQVRAKNAKQAEQKAIDLLWDDRLTCAGYAPIAEFEPMDDPEENFS